MEARLKLVSFRAKRRASNTGEMFERHVQYIYQTLVRAQGKNISVSRRATVQDIRGNSYNIDVYYQFEVAGIPHRVAIECKDTARPVERDDAIAFVGKIQDLPSTIGVFISNGGFQSAAKKYLEDHGVVHYGGDDLPRSNQLLAAMISAIALPSESALGQPFWTLVQVDKSGPTGVWCCMPDAERDPTGALARDGKCLLAFPLFYSKPHAVRFQKAMWGSDDSVAVRGVEQPMLQFLILIANSEGRRFSVMHPYFEDGRDKFACSMYSPRELADEYSAEDLSGRL